MCKTEIHTTVSTELRSKTDLSTGSLRIHFGTMCTIHIRSNRGEKMKRQLNSIDNDNDDNGSSSSSSSNANNSTDDYINSMQHEIDR